MKIEKKVKFVREVKCRGEKKDGEYAFSKKNSQQVELLIYESGKTIPLCRCALNSLDVDFRCNYKLSKPKDKLSLANCPWYHQN